MIDILFMDIDGVLTDGMVYIDSQGNESKRISFDDIDAIFALKRTGIRIGFITGEDNSFSEYVKERFSPDYFASGCKDKLSYFKSLEQKEGLDKSRASYVGDSEKDVELLNYLDLSFAPSNVDSEVKRAAKFILSTPKGSGVIKEVAKFILEGKGKTQQDTEALEIGTRKDIKTVAIIPARGGSKGIPHKNVKLLVGKPLIYYTIEACLETSGIERIFVSTDSKEIMEVSRQLGVSVVERPAKLAGDHVTSEEVLLHCIDKLESEGLEFNTVLFVQATSPLTEPSDLANLLGKMREGCDSAAFYTEDFGFFFGEGEVLRPRQPRQLREPRKREAGNAWAFWKDDFLRNKSRTFGRIGLCRLEPPKNLEIDTEIDLHLAERLLQLRERKRRQSYWKTRESGTDLKEKDFEASYWGEIVDPDGNRRNRIVEREQRIADVKEELDYINGLQPGRMLDIGCGMGDLLSAVRDGWEKHGLEVSELAAREASKYANIFVGHLKDAPYRSEYFDLVVMNHVIEHLEKPDEEILRVRGLLRHGGRLVIGTPDFDGAMARRYRERYRLLHDRTHISLFSRVSLRHFLEDYGFEVERESFPYFETRHFNKENLLRLFDTEGVSPPFWGSFMTFYCIKK